MTESVYFLVCGLGRLGQQCVVALSTFGVKVIGVEKEKIDTYEIPSVPYLLESLITGDCSYFPVLEQCNLSACRAALLVTNNEQVNIETALLIRQLNPHTRLVVRSGQTNLNQLLSEKLGNFVAYEPLDLCANAFALAALGNGTLGFFELDQQWLRVVSTMLQAEHPWLRNQYLYKLNGHNRRILTVKNPQNGILSVFEAWNGEYTLQLNDELIYVELVDNFSLGLQSAMMEKMTSPQNQNPKTSLGWNLWLTEAIQKIKFALQSRPIILLATGVILGLLGVGTLLFTLTLPNIGILGAFYRTFVLLLGGYGDLFAEIQEAQDSRWILEPLALLLTLAGIAFVGMLYALLTENLLATKFIFTRKRLPIPRQNHIVILGLGRVGQRIAQLLKRWKQKTVGITLKSDFDPRILSDIPIVTQSDESLTKANLATANSLVIVTDEDLLNLEVALISNKINSKANLVIRTTKEGLGLSLMNLLPRSQVLDTNRIAAEVFVGAAFGENILNLFRLYQQTVLVTEYQIESEDTLSGLLLAEIAYGYGVIPLLCQSQQRSTLLFPSDDVVLQDGDRLVILATIEGLRKIEIGDLHPKNWGIRVEKLLNQSLAFEGANTISRISGCSLQQARDLISHLPQTLSTPLYLPQAQRLIRSLKKMQILAEIVTK
ncbi:MAG: NAD-binding protein [Snowella sp.]|nr:NAD-binding protein [Snowella sp.]